MLPATIHKILAPLKQRILLMIGRVLILAVNSEGVLPQLSGELLQGEVLEGLQLIQQFGLASRPLPGAEGVAVFPMGDRSSGYVVATEDRRVRPGLEPGEAALYSAEDVPGVDEEPPEGQAEGAAMHSIRLLNGRVIAAAGDLLQAVIQAGIDITAGGAITLDLSECVLNLGGSTLTISGGGMVSIQSPQPIMLNALYIQPAGAGGGGRPAVQQLSADTVEIDADTLKISLGGKTFTYTSSGMPARIGTDTAGGDTIAEG